MKLNYLLCVIWCIILHGICGQFSSDPAPGRSPGPPSSIQSSLNINESNSNSSRTIEATSTSRTTTASVGEKLLSSSSASASFSSPIGYNEQNKSNNEIQVPQNSSNRKLSATSAGIRTFKQHDYLDKLSNEFNKMTDESFRLNRKPCKNISVTEYLLMKTYSPKILKLELNQERIMNNGTHSTNQPNPINIDVTHDAFDLSNGLVRNVIYTGKTILFHLLYVIRYRIEFGTRYKN